MKMVKPLVLFLFLFLIFKQTTPTQLPDSEAEVPDGGTVSDASLRVELDELKTKIPLLESSLNEKVQQLKSKEKAIKELNDISEEKSKVLASLQNEVSSLKEKISSNAKKLEDEAHGRATEIQEQINNLKKEIEVQNKKKDALEARAIDAEKRAEDLNLELEKVRQTNSEQQSRIRKTQRAIEVTEEELMKVKMEAASLSEQMTEVQDAWIPSWIWVHFDYCKLFVVTHWNKHGRPYLDFTVKKALETKSDLQKWSKPHIETFKSKWFPVVKKHCLAFANDFRLHLQSLASNAIGVYHASKTALEPHIVRSLEVVDPHYQEAKKLAKPYIDQISSHMKPHVDKARVLLKPYKQKVIRSYRKFVKVMGVYHQQFQATSHDLLNSHEITRPLATKEFTFYLASALVALPIILVLNVISSIFRRKPKKHVRNSHSSHTRRRAKRGHSDR